MSTSKRKAPLASPAALLQQASSNSRPAASSSSASGSSKRQRLNHAAAADDATQSTPMIADTIEDDPELEEQDRKRQQQGRKGRLITSGYESESSDEEGQDGGTHRRKAERKDRPDADDDEDDMFGTKSGDDPNKVDEDKPEEKRFLKLAEIEGQEFSSKSRDRGQESEASNDSEEEQDPDLELEDSNDEDEEETDLNALGERTPPTSPGGTPLRAAEMSRKGKGKAGGKRSKGGQAVKITGFNMKEEMQTGKFDAEGNYIENSKDPHADHDVWLAGNYSRSKIKAAREAQLRRERELQEKEAKAQGEDNDEDDVKKRLVEYMRRGETVLQTLQRLGREAKKHKLARPSQRSLTARKGGSKGSITKVPVDMDLDDPTGSSPAADPKQEAKAQQVVDLEDVTHLSSVLMSRFGLMNIYDQTYDGLLQDVRKSGLVRGNFDPAARFEQQAELSSTGEGAGAVPGDATTEAVATDLLQQWEYKWSPAYLAAAARSAGGAVAPETEVFGPYSEADIKAWSEGGYFGSNGERILLRHAGSKEAWQSYTNILSS